MNNRKKLRGLFSTAAALALLAAGCAENDHGASSESSSDNGAASSSAVQTEDTTDTSSAPVTISAVPVCSVENLFTDRDINADYDTEPVSISLDGSTASADGTGVTINGSDITIAAEGVYRFSGTLDDGQIVVDTDGKVQLILDNADVSCSDSAPIYVKNAKKVFVTLAEKSENSLTDGSSYTYENETDNEPDAVIFSTDSLTVNGSGSLSIKANYNEGITCKDDIVFTGGTINIEAVGNGIKGKDYIAVYDTALTVNAGGDGIKSTNIEEAGLGFIYTEGGTFDITAAEDGIQAETEFICKDGTFNIISGGGSAAAAPHQGGNDFGRFDRNQQFNSENTEDTTVSTKGVKGGSGVYISGGEFTIDSADDAFHSNGTVAINGGMSHLSSGGDGIHADGLIEISSGTSVIEKSYEGIESALINIKGGVVEVNASDDGFNSTDGTPQGGMGTYSDGVELSISGGTVYVNSDGDGLDSNGSMTISGGITVVNGPTNNGNGAIDGNGEIICSGGVLIASGSSGMAESPGKSSTQHSVSAAFTQFFNAGTLVTVCDGSGNEILSVAPEKNFSHIVISSPDFKDGENYTIYTGGTSSAEKSYGLYKTGGYNGDGTEAGSFTANDVTSYIGSQGNMMGGGSFGGGGRGDRNEWGNHGDMQLPTDENGEIDIQLPTNENGEAEMPEMPHGGDFGGGMMEPPTDENGMPEMPQGGFEPGMMQ